MSRPHSAARAVLGFAVALLPLTLPGVYAEAQVPTSWRDSLVFHTFSIAAVDPRTGEVGVAVTTRVPCVGNGVPWVRAGIGAVAQMAQLRSTIETIASLGTPLAEILPLASAQLQHDDVVLASAAVVEVDLAGGVVRYVCAGHPPPLLRSRPVVPLPPPPGTRLLARRGAPP